MLYLVLDCVKFDEIINEGHTKINKNTIFHFCTTESQMEEYRPAETQGFNFGMANM